MRENSPARSVCVVGAGTMGWGIAQVFASNGYSVKLCDQSEELALRGKQAMEQALKKRVKKGKMNQEDVLQLLSQVVPCLISQADYDSELAIEAVYENLEAKQDVLRKLEQNLSESTILATNTSSLSITELAGCLKNSERLIGMHFFNPAPVMGLVEVISGARTSPDIQKRVIELAYSVGKTPVQVDEAPGFVVNRLLIPMINEAVGLVAEGVASVEDIDCAMQLGASHRQGPLQTGDLIGLDVCLAIMEVLHQETGEDKYRPHQLLRKMVRAGKLGRKAGQGFYNY